MAMRTPPSWLQNGSHPAENDRLSMQALFATTGIVRATDLAVTAQGSPNMTVNVASGWAAIVGTTQANMGVYVGYNDANTVLTVTTANATNPRIDLVCMTVNDAWYSGSTNNVVLQIIAGTPAGSPVAPTLPANSISLATIAVAANATSISSGNITDTRVQTTTNLPVLTASSTATLTNKTLSGARLTSGVIEPTYVTATGFAGYTFYVTTNGAVQYSTGNSTASGALNVASTSGATLNSLLNVNDTITVTLMVTNGATAYYANAIQVDGTTTGVTTKWQGGTAPSAGNASAVDVYSLVITKTASATYTVLASQTKFA
jgi:hypothetical protein